ncbi:MAG: 16S rRNA (guanine(527)-N(7))-methyltransferase RsmG [Candidatus Bruticola sp.]
MKELIRQGIRSIDNPLIKATEEDIDRLARFAQNLFEHGSERGLTALTSPEDIVRELIVDSLGAMSYIGSGQRIADIGSGAGVPGIPLAIVRPESFFIMVESQNRKSAWIEEQILDLGIQAKAHALPMRIEDVAHSDNWRGKLDFVAAKALSSLPSLIELAVPLLKVNGCLLAYKGVKFQEEIDQSDNALNKLHAKVEDVFSYKLYGRERYICVIKKLKPTPKSYPRRIGMPQHSPL